MFDWLAENLGTILITLVLFAVLAGIVVSMYRDKKKGKSSCGCGCEHCAMHGTCHKQS